MNRKAYWKFFISMLIAMLLTAAISFIAPLFAQVYKSNDTAVTMQTVLGLVGLLVASKLLDVFISIIQERFAEGFNIQNCMDMLSQMMGMDYDSLIKNGPTNLLERIQMAVNGIYSYMTRGFVSIWAYSITITICLVLIAQISKEITLFLFLLLPINYIGFRLLNQELLRRSTKLQVDTSESTQEILSYVQQVDYIKQLNNYDQILHSIYPSVKKMYKNMASVNIYASAVSTLLHGVNEIVQNGSLVYLTICFANNSTSVYELILLMLVLPMYFSALNGIVRANLNRRDFDIAMDFRKMLLEHQETTGLIKCRAVEKLTLDMDCVKVSPDKEIPFSAHVTLKKGDIVRIAGASGTGKSSVAKALVKFRENKGIWVNGKPLNQLETLSFRSLVGYVSQNTPIIKGSLRDNLFLNHPWSKERESQLLNDPLMTSILQDKSMDTEILEGGANLSGGERQKIALARELMENVDILILDEVCSNIDTESAHAIYSRILDGRSARITFIITHETLPDGLINVELNGG